MIKLGFPKIIINEFWWVRQPVRYKKLSQKSYKSISFPLHHVHATEQYRTHQARSSNNREFLKFWFKIFDDFNPCIKCENVHVIDSSANVIRTETVSPLPLQPNFFLAALIRSHSLQPAANYPSSRIEQASTEC